MLKTKALKYRLTDDQKKLLTNENIDGKTNIQHHFEKIISNKILIEKGILDDKKDILVEKDLYNTQVNYLLNSRNESKERTINKYNVANYYFELAKLFNRIALERKISRNKLWHIIKKNIIVRDFNNTKLRFYKYIFRGELIPSPKYIEKTLTDNDDLPCYLSIIYLDESITPELDEAYANIHTR